MDRQIFAIDKIENNIALLENIDTQELQEISINLLPPNIKDGTILKKIDNHYILQEDEEEKRRREILERFKKLRNNPKLND